MSGDVVKILNFLAIFVQGDTMDHTIIGLFQCDPWCLPTQKWLKNATNDISIQEFYNVTRHYVKDTVKTHTAFSMFPILDKNLAGYVTNVYILFNDAPSKWWFLGPM